MKRLLTIATTLLIGMAAFTSCRQGGGTVIYPNSLTATVAGVLSFSASGANVTTTLNNGTLIITAANTDNSKIILTVPSYGDSIGTLAINNVGLPAGATYDSLASSTPILASTGTITFTSVTPYYQGTFSFVCTDSTHITTGTFKIKAP